MSNEMKKDSELGRWFSGSEDMPEPQAIVISEKEFQNDDGQALRVRVSGPQEQVSYYLGSMSFAFRTFEIGAEDVAAEMAYQKQEAQEGDDQPKPDPGAVRINFDFIAIEPPYGWEVRIDPLNVAIAGASTPHEYHTQPTNSVTSTIQANGGRLEMRMVGSPSVTVDGASREASVQASSPFVGSYIIRVDGLEARNNYDLTLQGALLA